MILFSFLIAVLGVTYWASIADPKFRRSHSTAFVVLLMLIGAERYRAERICQTPEVLVEERKPDGELTDALAEFQEAYQKGQEQWLAKRKSQPETQHTLQ